MPASLRKIVERAIRARQRCSDWFQKSEVRNEHADKTHAHFIEVLKQSVQILEPCVEEEDRTKKQPNQTQSPQVDLAAFSSRFAALSVDESPDIDPAEIAEVSAAVNVPQKTKASKGNQVIAKYELDDENEFDNDLAFIIYCFFEDLHRTQDFISGLWTKYKANACDLHTAAMTTNAAFDLVRQAEEDLIARAPKTFSKQRSWDTIAIIIFYADALKQGIDPNNRLNSNETLRITPFDNFIYLSTARILMKFTFLADIPKDLGMDYPVPCLPLRFGYISRPDLLESPEMKKREEEDLVLSRYIIDRHLWKTCRDAAESHSTPSPPPEDEFGIGLDTLMTKGVLSVALVFQARVYLDIQSIMGEEVKKGHQDLLKTTSEIEKIMNLKVVNGAWDVGGSGERWHEKDTDTIMRIKMTSMYWILDTPTNVFPGFKKHMLAAQTSDSDYGLPDLNAPSQQRPNTKGGSEVGKMRNVRSNHLKDPKFNTVSGSIHRIPKGTDLRDPNIQEILRRQLVESGQLSDDEDVDPKHEETARKLNIKPIKPSTDLRLLFTTNPIYCGVVSFRMLTDFEAAGISLCNWHKTVWPTAHLYNALQQTSSISKIWPEIEELIDLHSEALFAGCLPLSAHEFYVRFALSLGLSVTNFSRNPRRRTNADRLRLRQGACGTKLKVTEISGIFGQYFDGASLETSLVKLDRLMRAPRSNASRKEKDALKRPLTSVQFLAMLEAYLRDINSRLHFDYITLTKQCGKLLKNIRQQLELKFQIFLPRIPTEDSADQTLTFLVMDILENHDEIASIHQSAPPGRLGPIVSPRLNIAGEEMQKFLDTYRPQDLISNFNALPRKETCFSGLGQNHWNISIRHVSLSPPGDLVLFVHPSTKLIHSEGPIQIAEGQPPGHILNPKSLVTLQTIARLMMKAFVEGMSAPSHVARRAPWSWSTNDPNFARRIIKVMTDMGVRKDLLSMNVADADELALCESQWECMRGQLVGFVGQ